MKNNYLLLKSTFFGAAMLMLSFAGYTQYCTPRTSSSWGGISKVETTSGTNNISRITGRTTGYNNYTASDSISTNYGQTFQVKLEFTYAVSCWIDWNDDGDFADAGEMIGGPNPASSSSAVQNHTYNITVPNNAAYGQLRMRVYSLYYYYQQNGYDTRGCGYSSYQGEVEDYRIWIPEPLSNDAGVTKILPLAACVGNNAVKAKITNFGLSTLDTVTISGYIKENGGATTNYGPTKLTGLGLSRIQDTAYTVTTYNFLAGKTYDIEFRTTLPNGVTDTTSSNDTLTKKGFGPAMGGTYTIGTSTGKDYRTIAAAQADMARFGICAPTVFNMEQGTYTEQVKFTKYVGISATNNVRFRPDPANTSAVKWTYQSTSSVDGSRGTAVFDGAEHIAVDSINIINTGTSTGSVIELVNQSSYISFTGDSLIGNTSSTSTTSNMTVVRNYNQGCEYITLKNNVWVGAAYALYSYSTSSAYNAGWVIENNKILDFRYCGLYMYYHTGSEINWNEIENKKGQYGYYGMLLYYSLLTNVNYNKIHMDVTGYAYGLYSQYCRATSSDRKSISNNMIAITGGNGTHYGGRFYYNDYCDIDFNSISIEKGNAYPVYLYQGSSVNFRNNVIASWGTNYRYYQSGSQTRSNNVWWAPNAGSAVGNLGTNLLNVDPKFTSFTDLHTKSPDLYDAGISVAGITQDIDGDVRCPGTGCPGGSATPDRGADEYWLPNYDIEPASAGLAPCAGLSTIQVLVSNVGVRTLTSFTVNWKIGGVAQTPLVVTGSSVASGGDTLVTLGTNNFVNGITYNFEYVTSSPSGNTDQQTFNDTLRESMSSAMGGTYTIGGSTGKDFATITAAEAAMAQYGVCAPVVFNMEQGTYTEQVKFGKYVGVSAVNNVRFRPDPANTGRVRWTFSSTSSTDGSRGTAVFDGAEYIAVDSITIINTGTSTGTVIEFVNGPSFISLTGDSLLGDGGTSTSSNLNVVRNYNGRGNDITLKNSILIGGGYGIYSRGAGLGASGSQNWVIENCEILDFNYMGMYMYYHYKSNYNHNLLRNKANSYGYYGMYLYYDYSSKVDFNEINMRVTGYAYGLYTTYCRGTVTDRGSMSNNMVAIEGGNGTHYGARFYYNDYNDIDFNSISIEKGAAYPLYLYYGTGVNFRNNVIASWGTNFRYYVLGTHTASNNVWWAPNATAASGGLGSNLLNVDPGFKSFTDLHTKAAVLYNSGVITSTQTTDIDGDIRCPGTGCPGGSTAPDRGADEFWLPDYDITPVTAGLIPCAGAQDVKMRVANVGTRALTSFTVNWRIGGVAQTPLVVTSCNVPSGNDTLVTLGSHTFNAGITYNFEYVTSMPSGNTDQQTFNDTLSESLQNAMSGTFSVGKPSSDYPNFTAAFADLTKNSICGPVFLQLQDTTLSESFTIDAISGVSSVNTITIEQDPANTNPGELDGRITLGAISFLTVRDIIINTSGYAFQVESGKQHKNVKIDGNTFNLTGTGSGAYYDALYEKNSDSTWFINNTVNGGYYGLRFYGGSASAIGSMESNIFIENNNMSSFIYYGVYLYYSTNVYIRNNIIRNDQNHVNSTYPYGLLMYYSVNNEITKNQIQASGTAGGYGMYLYYTNRYGTTSDSTKIINNYVVVGRDLNTGTRRGINLYYYNYRAIVYHNNIKVLGNAGGEAMYTYYMFNSDFKNNIIENVGGTTWYDLIPNNVSRDYNAFWTGTVGANGINGGTAGTNSLVTNPRFKNPNDCDLRVNSIQLDSAAANVGINEDILQCS